jgi:uncharacterized protein YdhG (YjbR/CyaY superfamily)
MTAKQSARTKSVDDYLAELPEDAGRVLGGVREVIRDAAPDAEETISYGIPLYKLRGKHLIGFGASKGHLSLYVTDSVVLQKYEQELAAFDHAGTKTTVRFTVDKPLPRSLVKKIVRTRTTELDG